MKAIGIILSAAVVVAFSGATLAHPVPKPSKNYAGNYQTLVEDQKAPPQIARCIASGYDYAESGKAYDRIGFTKDDIVSAKSDAATVSISGQARRKDSGEWLDVTLRCAESNGQVNDIDIVSGK